MGSFSLIDNIEIVDSRLHGNDKKEIKKCWIPVFPALARTRMIKIEGFSTNLLKIIKKIVYLNYGKCI